MFSGTSTATGSADTVVPPDEIDVIDLPTPTTMTWQTVGPLLVVGGTVQLTSLDGFDFPAATVVLPLTATMHA